VTLVLESVGGRRARRLFRSLPKLLHRGHPAFIPPIRASVSAVLDRRRNPFWRHAEGAEWVVRRAGRPVGRIGACHDRDLEARVPGCGVVGFFDCADDAEAASSLFAAAEEWLLARGLRKARGPLNYSIHDTAGLLVEGFDTPPVVDTTWNPAYQVAMWERSGYAGVQDLLGVAGRLDDEGFGRTRAFAALARRKNVTVRPIDPRRFLDDVERIRRVYNAAWDSNWGHVPVGPEEFAFKAKDLKAILDPDLVRVAELEGEAVGFLLSLPDLNVVARRCGGRLFPLGWLHFLRARKTVRRARCVALGVVPDRRMRGLEALLLADSFSRIRERYEWCEASWVLEHNAALLNGLGHYGLHPYKRWRLYEKDLAEGGRG